MALLRSLTVFRLAMLLLLVADFLPAYAHIRAVNNCNFSLTVFYQSQNAAQTSFSLAGGQSEQMQVPSPWLGGVIWASKNANPNNAQATQIEFTMGGFNGQDFYDISVVNAYNMPAKIQPTSLVNGDHENGLRCGSPMCSIPDINVVCIKENKFQSPDNACINTDGTEKVRTESTALFSEHCPNVATYSSEPNTVHTCSFGTQYDVIWCPNTGENTNNGTPTNDGPQSPDYGPTSDNGAPNDHYTVTNNAPYTGNGALPSNGTSSDSGTSSTSGSTSIDYIH
ncbi:unnamed protein product [Calypogeia fissa]